MGLRQLGAGHAPRGPCSSACLGASWLHVLKLYCAGPLGVLQAPLGDLIGCFEGSGLVIRDRHACSWVQVCQIGAVDFRHGRHCEPALRCTSMKCGECWHDG